LNLGFVDVIERFSEPLKLWIFPEKIFQIRVPLGGFK